MQLMVANGKTEKDHFKEALNERVSQDYPEIRGRPVWLYDELQKYRRTHRRFQSVSISKQICAYWLKGEKLPTGDRLQLLCAALGMTRGQLFGETHDEGLALIVKRWDKLPAHIKRAMRSMAEPDEEEAEPPAEPAQPRVATR